MIQDEMKTKVSKSQFQSSQVRIQGGMNIKVSKSEHQQAKTTIQSEMNTKTSKTPVIFSAYISSPK